VQSQQLPTESQVLEDEVLPGTESADQPAEEMSERHNHGKNCSGKIRIQLFAKSFILQGVRRFGETQGKREVIQGKSSRRFAPRSRRRFGPQIVSKHRAS
jgi:hypothetical protein